jgi:hypothetical protein
MRRFQHIHIQEICHKTSKSYSQRGSRFFFLDHIPEAETYPQNGQDLALFGLEKTDQEGLHCLTRNYFFSQHITVFITFLFGSGL